MPRVLKKFVDVSLLAAYSLLL